MAEQDDVIAPKNGEHEIHECKQFNPQCRGDVYHHS